MLVPAPTKQTSLSGFPEGPSPPRSFDHRRRDPLVGPVGPLVDPLERDGKCLETAGGGESQMGRHFGLIGGYVPTRLHSKISSKLLAVERG